MPASSSPRTSSTSGGSPFYTFRVGDVTVRDWVAGLADGEAVPDVRCSDCTVAEENPRPAGSP